MTQVAIIDYGVGNLRSVEKAFEATGIGATVSSDERTLRQAGALVLPGVGAFGACMKALSQRGFDELVRQRVAEGVPLLGVCVGMQMLFDESEEFGPSRGLGFLRGRVRRFSDNVRVPHIGWNQVSIKRPNALLKGIEDGAFFYFVHSYYCETSCPESIVGETDYNGAYLSVVNSGNICGVQFHPEKSQTSGLRLLNNFAKLAGSN
jgi:imidazole glycerol-phosphate synthase subunit HisH